MGKKEEDSGDEVEIGVKSMQKKRVLVFSTRGVTARFRHLLDDLRQLLPHGKKESKMDTKERLSVANEICELRNCNWCILFECRKRQDLYIWMSKVPNGPSVKFHVTNVHTMAELKFMGNSLLFSRPLLSFDKKFDTSPHYRLLKEILTAIFAAPKGHRKTKPFIDHVISFFILDSRIWMRHYQIVESTEGVKPTKAAKTTSSELVEIGPRLVLNPVRIFSGSMCGSTIYENPAFIHPNTVRRMIRKRNSSGYDHRTKERAAKKQKVEALKPEKDTVNSVFKDEPEDEA
eukprot:Plantae.Rhodophyta-Purpureofilum_apyrenoidigerum.ctg8402.p1 GENE.Plantae.Rhodophyta-Purpureofilum_apyrenoidigerum.ctg8402~~Plantae.Rhodophyta-Purpureofilum_apyrenoidigerum.ctg8402.p1  ORF type:complete len:289 (-),score=55.47 Plantae.Rhodophyta-Purpureofilum_apyrenoidigerum.ctg8402:300-1166(-)